MWSKCLVYLDDIFVFGADFATTLEHLVRVPNVSRLALPVPWDLQEVRSFVGLYSYYRWHIQEFTELAAPLYELATKGMEFEWTAQWDGAFEKLKAALTSAPMLGFPNEWYLNTGASEVGTCS